MNRFFRGLLTILLLLTATQAYAENTFVVSPSIGAASISNIKGYDSSAVYRLDGGYFPLPWFGVGVFITSYPGFHTGSGGSKVSVKVDGDGGSLILKWPVPAHVQPYVRVDYMAWRAEASGFGRTLSTDTGNSAGFAVGAEFPIWRFIGAKAELSGYNNVSGADIRQFSAGMTFTF